VLEELPLHAVSDTSHGKTHGAGLRSSQQLYGPLAACREPWELNCAPLLYPLQALSVIRVSSNFIDFITAHSPTILPHAVRIMDLSMLFMTPCDTIEKRVVDLFLEIAAIAGVLERIYSPFKFLHSLYKR
jgi:hypothetical protein